MSEISTQEKKSGWRDMFSVIHVTWLAPLVIAVFSYFYLQPAPRLVYTLSDPIPISSSNSKSIEAVQQLSVTNVGNAKAENITVKLGQPILSGDWSKFSQADQPKLFTSNGEASYPLLPPGSSFKFVFRVPEKQEAGESSGVKSADLKITHNDGTAQDAVGDSRTSSSISNIVTLGLLGFQMLMVGLTIAMEVSIGRLVIDTVEDLKRVLKAKRPRYLFPKRQTQWEIRKESAIWGASRQWQLVEKPQGFLKSLSLNLLAANRPMEIEEDDWEQTRETAQKTVAEEVDYFLRGTAQQILEKAASIVRLQPQFEATTWSWLCKTAQKQAIGKVEKDYSVSATERLKLTRPGEFDSRLWDSAYNDWQGSLKREVERNLVYAREPLEELTKFDLSGLTEQQQQEITESANQKMRSKAFDLSAIPQQLAALIESGRPQWADDTTWQMLLSRHQSHQDNAQEKARLQGLSEQAQQQRQRSEATRDELVRLMATRQLSPQRPPLIPEKEWAELQVLELALKASVANLNHNHNGAVPSTDNTPAS